MISDISKRVIDLLGFHTQRKIIVIISDDWGGLRVRSEKDRENMIKLGIDMNGNRFDRYDMLESNKDLEDLFEVLLKYKDHRGNNPILTVACNVANPDFKLIKESGFSKYYYETFAKTLDRYPNHDKVFGLYKKGIELKLFRPEYHGREHLQVKWWLENLQRGNKMVIKAFDYGYWHLPGKYLDNPLHRSLSGAYDIASLAEVKNLAEIATDGLDIFEQVFGYRATLFIPPAQHYHNNMEAVLAESGIKIVDVPRLRKMPMGQGKYSTRLHYLGQRNRSGIRYITRNVVFEPNLFENSDGISECLSGIETSFRLKRPAIISNHRAAFCGGLDEKNHKKGLTALNSLLSETLKRWPDVEFKSANALYELMAVK